MAKHKKLKERARDAFEDSLSDWIYYDRKEDEELNTDQISKLITKKHIKRKDLIKWLDAWLEEHRIFNDPE